MQALHIWYEPVLQLQIFEPENWIFLHSMQAFVSTKYTIAMSITGNKSMELLIAKKDIWRQSFFFALSFLITQLLADCLMSENCCVIWNNNSNFTLSCFLIGLKLITAVLKLLILFTTLGAKLTLGLLILCTNSTYCAWIIGRHSGTARCLM